jgi:S-adenosylmethionine hydrolase
MIITLFTDFGTRDAYVAQMKGAILGIAPQVPIIDLNHEVSQFDLREAAYVLDLSARYFPAATIFVAVVDPGVGTARRPLLVVTRAQHFYIGPDNGIFTRVLEREGLQAAYVLQQSTYFLGSISATFHGRDIFGPVAAHLACGVAPTQFGPATTEIIRLPGNPPHVREHTIDGEIVHLDRFGNIVTNITLEVLAGLTPGEDVSCRLHERLYRLRFCATYGAAAPGQLICLINSNGEFEIALPQGSAAAHIGAVVGQRLVLTHGAQGARP